MGKIIFFTGGSRSGKSKFAEEYIYENKYENKIYFATAIAFDEEMKDRIKKHIERRGTSWKTIEGYKNLVSLVKNEIDNADVILFDCVTNFVSNYMIMDREIHWDNIDLSIVQKIEENLQEETYKFLEFIRSKKCDCVFVTNEIGSGLVPDYPLGRYFRDICGRINQIIAKNSDEAYLAVSGIKVKIK
ncbi:bifunctional adenosylcobinamide kinase/adenosylcobinamide-phosphate guanylyltransferase [Fusobacterium nucleatum]|uniref:bifunctional adenosylcobinamide kinase/adenosylcobinamide-phosphate guanylyltransferase n=1 Tax=Fusobacterium nucleatum TaxID=851 RepID=UPI003CFE2B51